MDVYLTEEERVEALKKWWKANSQSIIVGIALGVAIIVGWNTWQNAKLHKAQEASDLFQQLTKAVEARQNDPASKLAERIVQQHQGSLYATYASLFQAKLKVDANDFAGAKNILSDLLAAEKDTLRQNVIRLRLARAQQGLKDYDGALKTLTSVDPKDVGEFEKLFDEQKGDVFLMLNRNDDARTAYEKAKRLGLQSPILDMKLANLGATDTEASP